MDKEQHSSLPGLFGQKHSSRDYTKAEFWGKNQFNSSFPASLVAYMWARSIEPVYVCVNAANKVVHRSISGKDLFGIDPLSDTLYYNFEANYLPYEKYYVGKREKIDLVLTDLSTDKAIRGLEIKLTALPDNTTCGKPEDQFSCEIVVRPASICYLACSICHCYDGSNGRRRLRDLLGQFPNIKHWEDDEQVVVHLSDMFDALDRVARDMYRHQTPLMVQPVWKTNGKKPQLADNCLDVFVWSNLAVLHMCRPDKREVRKLSRPHRCLVWIYRMLFEFLTYGQFNYDETINELSETTMNGKGFAISGTMSYPLLKSPELACPRIRKDEIKNIILGGGQNLLSPERRFDAIIYNSPDLFA